MGDLVSINGKRTTLSALNAVLLETPGLSDGVVLRVPDHGEDRLSVVAVMNASDDLSQSEAIARIPEAVSCPS